MKKYKPHLIVVAIVSIIAIFLNNKASISTKERESFKQERNKLLEEKMTLINQVKELQKETIIEEIKTPDGTIKKVTKINERTKNVTNLKEITNKEENKQVIIKETLKIKHKGVQVGYLATFPYSFTPIIQHNLTISTPIFGPIRGQALIGIGQIGAGLAWEF